MIINADTLEAMENTLWDLKKSISYNINNGFWYYHNQSDSDNFDRWHGPFSTRYWALTEATEMSQDDLDEEEGS